MPKVDQVISSEGKHGFLVRHEDDRLAVRFEFKTRHDAIAAQMKMQAILARCEKVIGYG
jgi:hypothetical protein